MKRLQLRFDDGHEVTVLHFEIIDYAEAHQISQIIVIDCFVEDSDSTIVIFFLDFSRPDQAGQDTLTVRLASIFNGMVTATVVRVAVIVRDRKSVV